ncbi:hypothetical protein [Sphingomonas sp.]|uniref:hypothetical protein n=1 Tax=Sphingomonas sp. TaxID=28214 RepID=UPI0035BC326A
MILPILLSVIAAPQALPRNAGAMMTTAAHRLAATCDSADCAAPPAADRYRVASDDAAATTSKDRAIRDDGTRCNVVGARRCTSSGATILTSRR